MATDNQLAFYFKELKKIPVLQTQQTNALAIKAKTDIQARNKLVSGNLRYVIVVAKGFYGQGLSMEDLISEGNIGLITAVDKFKPEKDENFMKCAGWWIRHSIMFAISNNKVIRKPMNQVQEHKEIHGVYERERLTALDTPLDGESENGATIGDIIAAEIEDDFYNLEERRYVINEAVKTLDKKSRELIFKKYGIGVSYPMSAFSLSKEYKMSITSIDVMLRTAMSKMVAQLKKENIRYGE